MGTKKGLKIIGLAIGLAGWVLGSLGDWIKDKELDELVNQKVRDALADLDQRGP